MRRAYRLGLVVTALVCFTGCDRATKSLARELLANSPPVSVLNGFARFQYVENVGAFLGLGTRLPGEIRLLVVALANLGLLLTLVLVACVRRSGLAPLISLSLVASGGVGNLIDRVLNDGAVVDFVSLGIGCVRTGVFNLADVAIMVGAGMLLLSSAREMKGAAATA